MYQLFCDTNSEIPWQIAEEYGLEVVHMPYVLDDKEYAYDLGKHTDFKDFYARVRSGSMPITNSLNMQVYTEIFRPTLEKGTDILMISFSEMLSGTHQYLEQARLALLEEFPQRKFVVVNTLAISMGAGLIVYYAAKMWKDGKDIETTAQWVLDNRMKSQQWFTVDDLNHLKRGGRISAAAAMMGSMLDLKPVLTVNREGRLVVNEKAKGRKRALRALADAFDKYCFEPEKQMVSILHADSLEDAQALAKMITDKHAVGELRIDYVGPVIGTHCGPGTIGLCFMGKERQI